MSHRLSIIVARARNDVIGRDNTLPWRLPEDLRYFKASTLGHVLVMGRKTFDSIGRPLPGRRTIVVTRDPGWAHAGCERAGSLDAALAQAAAAPEVFIAGGAQLYEQALPRVDRLLITEVELDAVGDIRFPAFDPSAWRKTRDEPHVSADGTAFRLTEWLRTADPRPAPDPLTTSQPPVRRPA